MLAVSKDKGEIQYLNHFRAADANHDGSITAVELQQYFRKLGRDFPLSFIQYRISQKDSNGNQKLGYDGKN